jgi:DNA-binding beta-propeller fold protein YncE
VFFPKGDQTKGRLICKSVDGKSEQNPCKLFKAPFHLAIDQQDRIWVTNAEGDTVVRFPASDPSKAEEFPANGKSGEGMGIDSQGNIVVTNTAGEGLDLIVKARLAELKLTGKLTIDEVVKLGIGYLREHVGGSVTAAAGW